MDLLNLILELDPLWAALPVSVLVASFLAWRIRAKRRLAKSGEMSEMSPVASFSENFMPDDEPVPEKSEERDEALGTEDAFVSCYVFAHYGRFDMCRSVLAEHLGTFGVSDRLTEMMAWVDGHLARHADSWSEGWKDEWLSNRKDPVDEARELVSRGMLDQAREVLETALQESQGNPMTVRKALRDVNSMICSPGYGKASIAF